MRNKDTIILEGLYNKIYNEMAFGLGSGGTPMTIQQIMDLIIQKNETQQNREIPFSFTSVTAPKFYKKKCNYSTIYKITQTVANLGEYEKIVNRELEKSGQEANFEAGESSVLKERLSKNIGITKRDLPVLIMNITYIKSATSIFVAREPSGEIHTIEKEEANQLLYPPSPTVAGVKWRNYGIDKLVGIKLDGQEIVNSNIDEDKMQVFNYVRDQLKS